MKYDIHTIREFKDVPFDAAIAVENAFDEHHVAVVHKNTVKTCRPIMDVGDLTVMYYEIKPFKWFPWYTKCFLTLKRTLENGKAVNFVSFKINPSMISNFTVRAHPGDKPSLGKVEHHFKLRLPVFLRPVSGLILYLRNLGEKQRWSEDYELMEHRHQALQEGHDDNVHCLTRKMLVEEWFGKES